MVRSFAFGAVSLVLAIGFAVGPGHAGAALPPQRPLPFDLPGNGVMIELAGGGKLMDTESTINEIFNRNIGATDVFHRRYGDNFSGPDFVFRGAVPIDRETRVTGMAWITDASTSGDVRVEHAPGDTFAHGWRYSPNDLTLAVGLERDLFQTPLGTVAFDLYGGARWGSVDYTHTAQGPANSVVTETGSHSFVAPVVGAELALITNPWTLGSGRGGWRDFAIARTTFRLGIQWSGGDSFSSTVRTQGASSTVNFDTGDSTHGYALIGLAFGLRPAGMTDAQWEDYQDWLDDY